MSERARYKVLTENERADVQRYKELTAGLDGPFHYDVSDLPDEAVFTLMAFTFWRVGEAFREVWKEVRRALGVGE